MNKFTCSAGEEAELEAAIRQAKTDAWNFGISQGLKEYLNRFQPTERMQRILAMFAELETQLELCQRMLAIESDVNDVGSKVKSQIGAPPKRTIPDG